MAKKATPPAPLTSRKIKQLAGEGLRAPSTLSTAQIRELAGSVMAHIEPRNPPAEPTANTASKKN
jgi:hypothetical protein